MKSQHINKILEEFDALENISPSESWDLVFQKKLHATRLSKSNTIIKINTLMLILVTLNIAYIWNTVTNDKLEVNENRGFNLETISNELLIPQN
ncbi:hypothetical protein [Flavobacterium sp.]|uniref:hypothetical protein n=1 Tax=Flavobacterium sp. TaxID=239 RepID=UPI00286BF4A9|nr:hypothetical protein [Flavobacterium sp.]